MKKFINENTKTTTNQNVTMLRFASDYPKYFFMLGGKRRHAFEVTHLGVLDGGVPEGGGNGRGKNDFR